MRPVAARIPRDAQKGLNADELGPLAYTRIHRDDLGGRFPGRVTDAFGHCSAGMFWYGKAINRP